MSERLAELERAWLAEPEDQERLALLLAGCRRSGRPPRPDWLEARTFPAAELACAEPLQLRAVLPGGAIVPIPESPAGRYRIPRHRIWWIEVDPTRSLRRLVDALEGQSVPGLALQRAPAPGELAALTRLDGARRYLDLAGLPLTDALLEFVARQEALEALNLEGAAPRPGDGSAASLRAATGLRRLQRLNLRRVPSVSRSDVAALAALPELYELDLAETGPAAGGLREAIALRPDAALARLSLLACELDFEAGLLAALASLPGLEDLNLRQARVPGAELPTLAGAPRLRRLNLAYQTELDDAGLLALADLPALADLDLSCCDQITDGSAEVLRGWPELTRIGLLRTAVGPAWIEGLAQLPRLRALDLENVAGIDDACLQRLAGSASLEHLTLACCPDITAAGVRALLDSPSLVELDITACPELPRSLRDELRERRPDLRLRGPGRNQRDA